MAWLICMSAAAQWRGKVTDPQGKPLADVNVFIENSFVGTVSNAQGSFELYSKDDIGVLVFKYLGYETQRIPLASIGKEKPLSMVLQPTTIALAEVKLKADENPAIRIIRAAQAARKQNYEQSRDFKADYYSRGIIRTEEFPEKFMGQELNDLNEVLDSNRSGILYLSETRSKIFAKNRAFKEIIQASKVSGDNQGFTFNSAEDSEFNFYAPQLEVENMVESPVGPNALRIYRYQLENTFYTPSGQLINKIAVTPKVGGMGSFQGYVYIVEDDWRFYGVDLRYDKKGSVLDALHIQQIFNYNESADRWVKSSQVIDFEIALLKFKFNGRYSGIYSNYELEPRFAPKTFDRVAYEVLADANKKEASFWEKRPIPLTEEERVDYAFKEKLRKKRSSPAYLDSLEQVNNRWQWGDLTGKNIQKRNNRIDIKLNTLTHNKGFNPVTGWQTGIDLDWFRGADSLPTSWKTNVGFSYGWSDRKWYPYFQITTRRNRIQNTTYSLGFGRALRQFDSRPGISPLLSSFANLFYKENFIRLYQSSYLNASFSTRIHPSVRLSYRALVEYRERRINTTDYSFFNRDEPYAANLPYLTSPLIDHGMFVQSLAFDISFGVKEMRYPDRVFYRSNSRFPRLSVKITHGIGEHNRHDFLKYRLQLQQRLPSMAIGQSKIALEAGGFIDQDQVAFINYNHFGGNRTYFMRKGTFAFQMMPYYQFSTTDHYLHGHWDHNFGNNQISRLPGLRWLGAAPFIQANFLAISNRKPYFEGLVGLRNIGFGKFRFLSVAYGQLRYNHQTDHAILFGIQN